MPPNTKQLAYAELVAARKSCNACPSLTNPSQACGGKLDSNHIGPYSLWQGNLDSPVIVVGQDFADVDSFAELRGWPGEVDVVKTNKHLVELATAAGLSIEFPKYNQPDDKLFFTNAILCLKPRKEQGKKQKKMQASVPPQCFRECGRRFLRPTIELVSPCAVIALGREALDATLESYGLDRSVERMNDLIDANRTYKLLGDITLFPMCHPSPTVINTYRSLDKQKCDWARFGLWLADNHRLQLTGDAGDIGSAST